MNEHFRRQLAFSDHSWLTHLVPGWGALQALAMLAAVVLLHWRARNQERELLMALAAGFFGAAAGTVLLGALTVLPTLWREGPSPEALAKGGIVAYGALFGLTFTYALVTRRLRRPVPVALDLLAPCLGALVFFARIGCFLGGCDFGRVSTAPWALRFPSGSPAFRRHLAQELVLKTDPLSLPVHPTQLYEAGLGLLMLAVALLASRRFARRLLPAGCAFWLTAATYAAGRWVIELFRGDAPPALGPMSMSQWISVGVLAAAVFRLAHAWRTAGGENSRVLEQGSASIPEPGSLPLEGRGNPGAPPPATSAGSP